MARNFKVGDTVRTPDGDVTDIDRVWKNPPGRDDKPQRYHLYHVPSSLPGTPVEWWYARQLRLVRASDTKGEGA